MIKRFVISKLKYIFVAALLFGLSFILQVNFAIPLFLLVAIAYLKISESRLKNYSLLYPSFLFVLIFSISFFIIRNGMSIYYIPLCAVPMLATTTNCSRV